MGKSIIYGLMAGIGLLAVYFVVMRLGSGSWDYTVSELERLKFWVASLVLGFGIQVGLYSFLRNCQKTDDSMATGATATSATTSSVAMLACCAHHLTDILPFLGLAAAATFLATYQEWFLGLGILSNLVGILVMIKQIRRMQ